ncbi:hypothetical protein ACGTN6_20775, partial [Halomonas sp. THAF12]|uniref:hypothetical protein n=1 Tax=Halomonas sp. B23F22_10 TaxID=3459515 RepID=UPI00373F2452
MLKRLNSIRYTFVRSHLYGLFLTVLIGMSVLLGIYVLREPEWLTSQAIFFFIALFSITACLVSVFIGFQSSRFMREKMYALSMMVRALKQGSYEASVHMPTNDEFGDMGGELNELAQKLQN